MDYGIRPATYECKCFKCKVKFSYTSLGIGPTSVCEDCAVELLEIIFGFKADGRDKFGCIAFDMTKPLGGSSAG